MVRIICIFIIIWKSFIPKNIPHRTCPVPEEYEKKQKWDFLFIDTEITLKKIFSDAPEKYTQMQKNLSEEVFNFLLFFDRLNSFAHDTELSDSDSMNYVRKIVNYMELHYMEDLKAKDLAKNCGLSETHMRRIFSEYANMPPSEYLNVVRINKACELLAHKNVSIEEAARSVGYPVLST